MESPVRKEAQVLPLVSPSPLSSNVMSSSTLRLLLLAGT